MENLRNWVLRGIPPPRGYRLKWENGGPARDGAGNQMGGIRAAEFEVPIAFYAPYPGNDQPGCRPDTPFPYLVRNPLPHGEIVQRYGTREHYLELYDAATDRLVDERWLLFEDALHLKATAREYALQQF